MAAKVSYVFIKHAPESGEGKLPPQAATILKEFPGVTGIELADAQLLRVDFDGDEQAAAQLLKKLLLGDIAVADFHRAQMNLEKVFMEVTQDD